MSKRFFVINTKNYLEASGNKLDQLASFISYTKYRRKSIEHFLAVPAFDLRYLHTKYKRIELLTQHLDESAVGASTGTLVPEFAKISGARGSIINHSERRLDESAILKIVNRLRDLKMISIVCARNDEEVSRFTAFNPDFVAVEPPELIGSGKAVSRVSPEIISRSRAALDNSKGELSKTKLLCGAGIVEDVDASKAVELGAEGILVASGVVLSKKWKTKIEELSRGLIGTNQ